MKRPEMINGVKELLTIEKLEQLILGDYPQHSALYVLSHLDMVDDGSWSTADFFEKTNISLIKSVGEYVDGYCASRNLQRPDKMSSSVTEKAAIIDGLVVELKQALTQKADLKTIYAIVRRFETEAGVKMQTIPSFEK